MEAEARRVPGGEKALMVQTSPADELKQFAARAHERSSQHGKPALALPIDPGKCFLS